MTPLLAIFEEFFNVFGKGECVTLIPLLGPL